MTASPSSPSSPSAPSADLCPHFGECGGCRHQDLPYPEQLDRKARQLAHLFAAHWSAPIPVAPSPRIWHYRNKIELNFDRRMYEDRPPPGFERETVLGFKRVGKWYWTLDLQECRIGPAGLDALIARVRQWQQDNDLKARFQKTREGALRYLVVRESAHRGERMVMLVTTSDAVPEASFVDAVQEAWPADGIFLGIHNSDADAVILEELRQLAGAPAITEELHIPTAGGTRQLAFSISPMAFFQTNSLATEILYGKLRHWVEEIRPPMLYDLYGGAGGIALTCADLVPRIISVESVPEATQDGHTNCRLNHVDHIEFITEDVRRYLAALRENGGPFETAATAIVDPPRSGMHPKALGHLAKLGPAHILYVSCNPKMLARELPALAAAYRLRDLQAVDLFPHTPHVEVVAWLERLDAGGSAGQ